MAYVKTTWIDDVTPLSATNLNNIETGIEQLSVGLAGIITLWSGAKIAIPSGWFLCDGTNGTPNLQDRFIIGAGSTYAVGATGGESTHVLTTEELPAHNHSYPSVINGTSGTSPIFDSGIQYSTSTGATGNTGSGTAHENKPPYYALCYIMKA